MSEDGVKSADDAESPHLERGIGLAACLSANMLAMIGVGPFMTIPAMLKEMGGPHIIYAWLVGAVLALCDGLVYAELGAAMPGSGGPYLYLREAYRPWGLGRLLAFVYLFQFAITMPLTVASGGVGFADYLGFYWTSMTPLQHNVVAAAICMCMTLLLYRPVSSAGHLSVIMLVGVLGTISWVLVVGAFNFSWQQAWTFPPQAYHVDRHFWISLGAVSLLAMYNYGGYNTVCNVGEEVRHPHRNIPRSIVLSIVFVVFIYIAMSTVILGLVSWQEAAATHTVASLFIARCFSDAAHGAVAAKVMTGLILFVTATSLYALLLGGSRVLFAAARDGQFFPVFARLHPRGHFPHVALLVLGLVSLPFCFFTLQVLITCSLQIQILLQFIWQCAAILLIPRYRPDLPRPFVMWGYPWPAILSLAMWLAIFFSSGLIGILFSAGMLATAVLAFYMFLRGADAAVTAEL